MSMGLGVGGKGTDQWVCMRTTEITCAGHVPPWTSLQREDRFFRTNTALHNSLIDTCTSVTMEQTQDT